MGSSPIRPSRSPSTSSAGRSSAPALGIEVEFPLDDATRERFLEGLDDIGITLQSAGAIGEFEALRPDWLPTA